MGLRPVPFHAKLSHFKGVLKMIMKKYLKGGLGNQMFQYAMMRAVQEKYFPDAVIELSFRKIAPLKSLLSGNYEMPLDKLNATFRIAGKIKLTLRQRMLIFRLSAILFFYKFIVRKNYVENRAKVEAKFQDKLLAENIVWWTSGYHEFEFSKLDKTRDVYFYGYFESPKYFDGIKEILQREFKLRSHRKPVNMQLYWQILDKSSTCLHVRRGDFVGSSHHAVCTPVYYEHAVAKIQTMVPYPQFVVFSDDIEYVRERFWFLPPGTQFEPDNLPVEEVFRLMRNCRNFVISNSTFSWWAQYLAEDKYKVVIAPDHWTNDGDGLDIYQDNWIVIPT